MATLLDVTISHVGWQGGTFATGGWNDWFPVAAAGMTGVSYYAESLNGAAIDQAAAYATHADDISNPLWFNVHASGVRQGATIPSPFVVPAGVGVRTFTRHPSSSGAILWRLIVTGEPVTPPPVTPPCQYGTELIPGSPAAVIISQQLIDDVLAAASLPLLGPFFGAIIGVTLAAAVMCSEQPPPMPALDPEWWRNDPATILQAFKTVSWPYFCRCVPGTPAPVPYPPPSWSPPVGWPTPPTFGCDPSDICATLVRLETLLNQVSGTVANAYNLTAIVQRWGVPFEVIPGNFHEGLTGEGEFGIERLIGVQYELTAVPPTTAAYPGVPLYLRDVGWIGFQNFSGSLQELRVSRQQKLWLPPEARLSNRFGWSLVPGAVMNVRELHAEP